MVDEINTTTLSDDGAGGMTFFKFAHLFMDYFGSYVIFIIICFGILGNLLSIVIFVKRRKQDGATAQYLGTLAVFDLVNLGVIALTDWMYTNLHIVTNDVLSYHVLAGNAIGCKVWLYVWHTVSFVSAWIIIAFSVERCLVIWYPLKMAAIVSSSKWRKKVLAGIILVPCIIYTPTFVWTTSRNLEVLKPHRFTCHWKSDISSIETITYMYMFVILAIGLPCVLIAIINTLILVGLRRNRFSDTHATERSQIDEKRAKNEMRCLKNLLFVSTFYIFVMSPFVIVWTVFFVNEQAGFPGFTPGEIDQLAFFASLTTPTTYLNYAVNPISYCFCLNFYRKELVKMFCFPKSSPNKNG